MAATTNPRRRGGWLVDDLGAREPWRVPVPQAVRDELAATAARCPAPALGDGRVTHLPHTARLARLVQERLADPGFVVLSGLPVDDEETALRVLWVLGRVLGRAVPQSRDGALVGRVEDLGADFDNPRHRGHKTSAALPFHVDRTDVIALLCVRAASNGGLSQLASAAAVHDVLLDESPDLLEELYAPLPHDRRGEESPGEAPWCQVPVFSDVAGELVARYVRRFVEASQRHPAAPRLTPSQRAALDAVDDVLARPGTALSMDLRTGDLQLIHNFTILHARSAFTGRDDGPGRLLLRLWLSSPRSPDLPHWFAPLYGSTARGTVRGGVWPEGWSDVLGRPVEEIV